MSELSPEYTIPPDSEAGWRYGDAHAELLAARTQAVYDTYTDWERRDIVPIPTGEILGIGRYSRVEAVGDDLARRAPGTAKDKASVGDYLPRLVRGIDVIGLEQVKAANSTYTYSTRLHGPTKKRLCATDLKQLSLEPLDLALGTFLAMQAHGLAVDYGGENVFLGRLIAVADYDIDPTQTVQQKVMGLARLMWEGNLPLEKYVMYEKEARARLQALKRLAQAIAYRQQAHPDFWSRIYDEVGTYTRGREARARTVLGHTVLTSPSWY